MLSMEEFLAQPSDPLVGKVHFYDEGEHVLIAIGTKPGNSICNICANIVEDRRAELGTWRDAILIERLKEMGSNKHPPMSWAVFNKKAPAVGKRLLDELRRLVETGRINPEYLSIYSEVT